MALIQYGAKGDSVKQIQQQLKNAGYNIAVDGIFGKQTKQAIMDFQKKNGLKVDGIVGQQTLSSLNKITTPTTNPTTTPTASSNNVQTTAPLINANGMPNYQTMPKFEMPKEYQKFNQPYPELKLPTFNEQYTKQAEQTLNPMYEGVKETLKQKLSNILAMLDMQKENTNQMYDETYKRQELANKKTLNNFNNSILSRGLGRSSIAVSGQAELEQIGNRNLADIEAKRNAVLSQIEQQKVLKQQEVDSEIASLDKEKQTKILELARQLYNDELNKAYKEYGANVDKFKMQYDIWNNAKQDALRMYQLNVDNIKYQNDLATQMFKNKLSLDEFNFDKSIKQQQLDLEKEKLALEKARLNLAKQQASSSASSKSTSRTTRKTNTNGSVFNKTELNTNDSVFNKTELIYLQTLDNVLNEAKTTTNQLKILNNELGKNLSPAVKTVLQQKQQELSKKYIYDRTIDFLPNLLKGKRPD